MNEDNDEVCYCSNCLSLAIITESGVDYCKKCGCSIIETDTTDNWVKKYNSKYPKKRALYPRGIFEYHKPNKYYN
jgi:hypothetical protein